MNAKTYVLTALLLTASVVALAPAAIAHPCTAEDPEQSCGECRSGAHSHRYRNGDLYCSSSEGDPGTNVCLSDLREIAIYTPRDVNVPEVVVIGRIPPPDCVTLPELKDDAIELGLEKGALLP